MSKWLYFLFVIGLIALAIFTEKWITMLNPILFFIVLGYIDLGDMGKINFIKKLDDKIVSCISSIFNFGGLICKLVLFVILIFLIISYILYFFRATDPCCYWSWLIKHYHFVTNSNFGQIGDIVTPMLTAITLYYVYRTYKRDGFEKIFYSYLEQNRNLCTKKKSFEKMYNSFQDIYSRVLYYYESPKTTLESWCNKETDEKEHKINHCELAKHQNKYEKEVRRKLMMFSYELFYYGNEMFKGKYYENGNDKLKNFINDTSCYKANNEILGIYYRNLFQCVKFIHKSTFLSDEEKQEYAKILRTSMSDYAQLMLYYNCFSERGKAWLDLDGINLIEHYSMIQNVPKLDVYVGIEPNEEYKIEFEYKKIKSDDDFSSVF